MSIELYSVLFYGIVTNSLSEIWFLLNYISPKKHLMSSTISLLLTGTLGVITPFIIIIFMAYHEFGRADAITENWMVVVAAYVITACLGWLFIVYKKLNESKSKHTFAMPK